MGNRCSADQDGGVKPATSTNRTLVTHQPATSEGAQDNNRLPRSQADSAALEGWRNVQHLQFQAFAAAAASTPSGDWHRRNALINCIALVCKGLCRELLWRRFPQRWFVHRLVAGSRAGRWASQRWETSQVHFNF